MRTARVVLLLLAMPALASAQTSPPVVFPVDVGLVRINVSVEDQSGVPVAGLKAPDFVVYEDGKPRAMELFAASAAEESGTAAGGIDEALSIDLGLLMDTSESMRDQLAMEQLAAIQFLESVPHARELYTIFFDEDIRISRFDNEQQQGLMERIMDAKPKGRTVLNDAIAAYISRVQDGRGRQILVLLTDGEDSISQLTQSEVFDIVRSSSVTIYPIAFTGSLTSSSRVRSTAYLQGLAELSGGQMFTPRGFRDLSRVFRRILADLGGQYVIGLAPTANGGNARFRKLRIEVKRSGLKVRHRKGYIPFE